MLLFSVFRARQAHTRRPSAAFLARVVDLEHTIHSTPAHQNWRAEIALQDLTVLSLAASLAHRAEEELTATVVSPAARCVHPALTTLQLTANLNQLVYPALLGLKTLCLAARQPLPAALAPLVLTRPPTVPFFARCAQRARLRRRGETLVVPNALRAVMPPRSVLTCALPVHQVHSARNAGQL